MISFLNLIQSFFINISIYSLESFSYYSQSLFYTLFFLSLSLSLSAHTHTHTDIYIYIYIYIRANQKFFNILQTWGTIRQLQMLLLRSWRWRTTLDIEMLSSPDTLRVLLTGFGNCTVINCAFTFHKRILFATFVVLRVLDLPPFFFTLSLYQSIYLSVSIYICIFVNLSVCLSLSLSIYIYIYIYWYVCVCVCVRAVTLAYSGTGSHR